MAAGVNAQVREWVVQGQYNTVIQYTEDLATRGAESVYCRLVRAALYLKEGEQEKFKELMPQLREPRGYHLASDVYELGQQVDVYCDSAMSDLFGPLKKRLDDDAFKRDQSI